ncbi:MAG: hypothetical protein ABR577_06570 [Pyrinomonadaceae bacterium]
MAFKINYLILIATIFVCTADARISLTQGSADQSNQGLHQSSSANDEDKSTLGSPGDEIRARNEIKRAEKTHRENIERAREAMELSFKVRGAYTENKALGQTDRKALERLEKIVRRIRNEAGGSSGDEDEGASPQDVSTALARLTEASEALRTGVEKTPRLVVSATVIERANELLQLTRYLRGTAR